MGPKIVTSTNIHYSPNSEEYAYVMSKDEYDFKHTQEENDYRNKKGLLVEALHTIPGFEYGSQHINVPHLSD